LSYQGLLFDKKTKKCEEMSALDEPFHYKEGIKMKCAPCSEKKCTSGKDCTDIKAEVSAKYVGEDLKILMTADTLTENFYMQKTRLETAAYWKNRC